MGLLFKVRGGREEAEWRMETDGVAVLRGWGGGPHRVLSRLTADEVAD